MRTLVFPDVHVYEARNSYWPARILEGIAGENLYQTRHETRPWGFKIHCDDKDKPYTVEFDNGKKFSFCGLRDNQVNVEWPLFLGDYPNGNISARVEKFRSDSMNLTLSSDNSVLLDLLIWHYPPRNYE
jgi:hypothetical protein